MIQFARAAVSLAFLLLAVYNLFSLTTFSVTLELTWWVSLFWNRSSQVGHIILLSYLEKFMKVTVLRLGLTYR